MEHANRSSHSKILSVSLNTKVEETAVKVMVEIALVVVVKVVVGVTAKVVRRVAAR